MAKARIAPATVTVVVVVAITAFAATRSSSTDTVSTEDASDEVTTTTERVTTTSATSTSTSSSTSTTTSQPEVAAAKTVPPATQPPTTAPAPTVPPTPAADWGISPSSGPAGTSGQISGTGCLHEGSAAGMLFSYRAYDPAGNLVAGDGGTVDDDGSWAQPFTLGSLDSPPGQYRVVVYCSHDRTTEFLYPAGYYTVTG